MILILHNIRSAHNVGSIFRTADCAGVEKIFLSGYTTSPIDRFGRKRNDVAKVALGAEETLPWERADIIFDCIKRLREEGRKIYAVEQHRLSTSCKDVVYEEGDVFILGNEVDGLPTSILESVDEIIEIPLFGSKKSLNVSVCAGVLLFTARLSL